MEDLWIYRLYHILIKCGGKNQIGVFYVKEEAGYATVHVCVTS